MSDQAGTSVQEQHGEDSAATYTRMSWRDSYWVIGLIALSIGMLTIAVSIVLDWAIHDVARRVYASDILDGVAAAVLSGFVLIRMQSHGRELLKRMQIVEDVNHHVRNALTAITLSSSLREDPELNARVRDACDRIDWVLNDVLSQTISDRGSKGTHRQWHSGRRLPGVASASRGRTMRFFGGHGHQAAADLSPPSGSVAVRGTGRGTEHNHSAHQGGQAATGEDASGVQLQQSAGGHPPQE
jgi:signal transduction histidine kinase